MVERLASAESIEFVQESLAAQTAVRATPQFEVAIVYEQKIDTAAERERLTKEKEKLEGQIANAERQLANERFLSKAPANVVEGLRKQEAENKILLAKAQAALDKLG
jgi:valyl-tRNA synthetase